MNKILRKPGKILNNKKKCLIQKLYNKVEILEYKDETLSYAE